MGMLTDFNLNVLKIMYLNAFASLLIMLIPVSLSLL